jgi:hypothetical protein
VAAAEAEKEQRKQEKICFHNLYFQLFAKKFVMSSRARHLISASGQMSHFVRHDSQKS